MQIRSYKLSKLEMGDFTLAGYSVAGEESVILAPELDCAFDIGKCPREAGLEDSPMRTRSKAASAISRLAGRAREPNERRDLASSYVCREAEDLCRDVVSRLPSPGLLEFRPRRLTPSSFGTGRERSS